MPAALGPTPRPRPTCPPLTTVPCCERPLCYSRPSHLLRLLCWALPLGLVLLALTTVPCCERPLCYSRPARLLCLLHWALPLGLVLLALSLLCHAVSVPCVTVAPPACCACCTGPYPSASSYLPSHYCAML